MNGAFFIAATGLRSQETALQAHANNIANWNTSGFKRSEVRFSELAARGADSANADSARARLSCLLGVRAPETSRVFEQGELRKTDNRLDLAIDGPGFIEVLGPNGQILLSRGGRLRIDANGQLATASGLPLKSLIAAPEGASDFTIDAQGAVRARLDGQDGPSIGRIELVTVRDTGSLRALGDGLYEVDGAEVIEAAQPGADGAGRFAQGMLEGSNVRLADEMVTILLMQRSFAANSQVVQAADQLMSIANGLMK
jgi:flagellar basal-body rod protein FlgG